MDAAWEAAFEAEMAGEGGLGEGGTAALLLDISKCYARIPLAALARHAVQRGWPVAVISLAIRQYEATRWVSVAGAIAEGAGPDVA